MAKHWSQEEKDKMKQLIAKGLKPAAMTIYFVGRSAHSVLDMYIKTMDAEEERHKQPWLKEEDLDLLNGMKNPEFRKKWKRGQWETNQRRHDVSKPQGRFYHLYHDVQRVSLNKVNTTANNMKSNMPNLVEAWNEEGDTRIKGYMIGQLENGHYLILPKEKLQDYLDGKPGYRPNTFKHKMDVISISEVLKKNGIDPEKVIIVD